MMPLYSKIHKALGKEKHLFQNWLNREKTACGFFSSNVVNRLKCKQTHLLSDRDKSIDCSRERKLILGIETSCDDTGAAVVDNKGIVLGESLSSQLKTHLK